MYDNLIFLFPYNLLCVVFVRYLGMFQYLPVFYHCRYVRVHGRLDCNLNFRKGTHPTPGPGTLPNMKKCAGVDPGLYGVSFQVTRTYLILTFSDLSANCFMFTVRHI